MGVTLDRRGINPADMPVRAAVNQIDPAMSSVSKDHDGGAAQVEFHHGFADRQPLQGRRRFGTDSRMPLAAST